MPHHPHVPWRGRRRPDEDADARGDGARDDRPYFNEPSSALCKLAIEHEDDAELLRAVVHELFHRRGRLARDLRLSLLRRIERLEG